MRRSHSLAHSQESWSGRNVGLINTRVGASDIAVSCTISIESYEVAIRWGVWRNHYEHMFGGEETQLAFDDEHSSFSLCAMNTDSSYSLCAMNTGLAHSGSLSVPTHLTPTPCARDVYVIRRPKW